VAYVEVFHTSPKDGSVRDLVVVPVILGAQIVSGYTSYLEHVVKSGETLWGDRAAALSQRQALPSTPDREPVNYQSEPYSARTGHPRAARLVASADTLFARVLRAQCGAFSGRGPTPTANAGITLREGTRSRSQDNRLGARSERRPRSAGIMTTA
jgi:hypothetical protein